MSMNFSRKATGLVRQAGAWTFSSTTSTSSISRSASRSCSSTCRTDRIRASTCICRPSCVRSSCCRRRWFMRCSPPPCPARAANMSMPAAPFHRSFGFAASWNYTIWCFFYIGVPAAFLGKYGISALFRPLGVYSARRAHRPRQLVLHPARHRAHRHRADRAVRAGLRLRRQSLHEDPELSASSSPRSGWW